MYALQRLQNVLPFNPQDQSAVSPDLAFNTSVSFVTNTNWQSYVPETTMSYLTQMAGAHGAQLRLGGHRHRARHRADPRLRPALGAARIGNFWVDLTRCVLYILLPHRDRRRAGVHRSRHAART